MYKVVLQVIFSSALQTTNRLSVDVSVRVEIGYICLLLNVFVWLARLCIHMINSCDSE